MEITLTAYNEQVRKYTAAPTATARTTKITRLAMFMANFAGIFEKSFTKARKAVLDEIIYKSAETGIYAAKAETIATNCDLSVKTVTRAVAEIKKSNEYVIAYSATGRKGGYIFIDRKHENFATIMVGLFGEKVAADFIESEQASEQESEQQNAETPTESKAQAAKIDEPTVLSALDAKKSLEPKNQKGARTNIKTALYVRLSEVLAESFGKEEMVDVIKHVESLRKKMTISDELIVATADEAAHAQDCRNFFGLWTYKIKSALGIVSKREAKALPSGFVKDDRSKLEKVEDRLKELRAKKAENDASGALPYWFYDEDIRRAELRLEKLRKEAENATQSNEPTADELEQMRLACLARLGK